MKYTVYTYRVSNKESKKSDTLITVAKKHMKKQMYKVGDRVPQAGRYQCVVCGLILEFLPKHIKREVLFNFCPLCFAGTENGLKKPDEDIWTFLG